MQIEWSLYDCFENKSVFESGAYTKNQKNEKIKYIQKIYSGTTFRCLNTYSVTRRCHGTVQPNRSNIQANKLNVPMHTHT